MKVLALSTSTPRGSAAVLDDRAAIAEATYADLKGHAERLFAAIDVALAEAGLHRTAIEAVACDVGPGSFTGVRVGVASAKGIALALGIPIFGVPSLEAMAARAFAEGAAGADDLVLAAIDAKKSEVFLAVYALEGGALRTVSPPRHCAAVPEALVLSGGTRRIVVVGEIAATILAQPRPLDLGPAPYLARGAALDLPDAVWVGRCAVAGLAAGAGVDPAVLEPLYVRAPDAKPQSGAPKAEPLP
jgi:tRNA threonylcarbamoyladenosine biosynthesis protein TsaB